jgi:hypothetical protein
VDEVELAQAVRDARTRIAETIDSAAFVARCMRDAAADLRRRARKLESGQRHRSTNQDDLVERKARALHLAAAEIDRAADAVHPA